MRNGIPVTGDFNGDGITDVGFFYNGQWFIDLNGNGQWDEGDLWAKLGHEGDLPVTGDWDGDGKTDIGIFGRAWPGDPSAIRHEPGLPAPLNTKTGPKKNVPPRTDEAALGYRTLKHTSKGDYRADVIDHVFHYGTPGDIPVTGDWHGTGVHTIGLFYKGRWILDSNGDGKWTETDHDFRYGADGDQPVVGDFNGDGIDELGVYRDGTWYIDTNNDRVLDAQDKLFELGGPGDVAVVGDWNGDGVDEPGVYHEGARNVAAAPAAVAGAHCHRVRRLSWLSLNRAGRASAADVAVSRCARTIRLLAGRSRSSQSADSAALGQLPLAASVSCGTTALNRQKWYTRNWAKIIGALVSESDYSSVAGFPATPHHAAPCLVRASCRTHLERPSWVRISLRCCAAAHTAQSSGLAVGGHRAVCCSLPMRSRCRR